MNADEMKLTPKEELAVVEERLKRHRDKAKHPEAKKRLDIAVDLVRRAIAWMEE